jgi:hypothetical protein
MQVESIILVRHYENADVGHRAEVNKLLDAVRDVALVEAGHNQPLPIHYEGYFFVEFISAAKT